MSEREIESLIEVSVKDAIKSEVKNAVGRVIAWAGLGIFLVIISSVIVFQNTAAKTIQNSEDIKDLKKSKADLELVLQMTKDIKENQKDGYLRMEKSITNNNVLLLEVMRNIKHTKN